MFEVIELQRFRVIVLGRFAERKDAEYACEAYRAQNPRLRFAVQCRGGCHADNQGLCHTCGELLNPDYAENA